MNTFILFLGFLCVIFQLDRLTNIVRNGDKSLFPLDK